MLLNCRQSTTSSADGAAKERAVSGALDEAAPRTCAVVWDALPAEIGNPAYGYSQGSEAHSPQGAIDLAIFYGRNNLLLMAGAVGEQLAFARA